jgi:hypothetical protein
MECADATSRVSESKTASPGLTIRPGESVPVVSGTTERSQCSVGKPKTMHAAKAYNLGSSTTASLLPEDRDHGPRAIAARNPPRP